MKLFFFRGTDSATGTFLVIVAMNIREACEKLVGLPEFPGLYWGILVRDIIWKVFLYRKSNNEYADKQFVVSTEDLSSGVKFFYEG